MKKPEVVIGVGVALCLFLGTWYFLTPKYGKVSHEAYQFATALYGASLAKSEDRIRTVENMLEKSSGEGAKVSDVERKWLLKIIEDAKNGAWERASRSARVMMEDQVE